MNAYTLAGGLIGYFLFEALEARKRSVAVGSTRTVSQELKAMWPVVTIFGLSSMAFAGFMVEGFDQGSSFFEFSVDRIVRGGASGFALVPVLTRFRSTLPDQRIESVIVRRRGATLGGIVTEYLRLRT